VPDGRERLTPRVRRVLTIAEDEAVGLRQSEVGTEHVLLALLREGRGLATRALRELGVEPTDLAQRLRLRLVPAQIGPDGPIGLGPGARAAIQMARAEAARLHHNYLGTEHLLLGLLRDGEGPAFVVLNGAGVTLGRARQQISKILNESAPEAPGGRAPGLAILRGRERPSDRFADPDLHDPRDDEERCGRCGRIRRSDWRFCAYCGEKWPACDRCEAPIPELAGVRFCPGCGVMLDSDDRA
jgi:ATP-dependent Clp protease ATP-binding subunit ClpA